MAEVRLYMIGQKGEDLREGQIGITGARFPRNPVVKIIVDEADRGDVGGGEGGLTLREISRKLPGITRNRVQVLLDEAAAQDYIWWDNLDSSFGRV